MTAEEKDQEWRNALACYGFDITGTTEEVVKNAVNHYRKIDWAWREEITKYLPQISVMSFVGPRSTIKWLMDHVDIKPEHKVLAEKLIAIEASGMSKEEKSDTRLQAIFPNLGPRIK